MLTYKLTYFWSKHASAFGCLSFVLYISSLLNEVGARICDFVCTSCHIWNLCNVLCNASFASCVFCDYPIEFACTSLPVYFNPAPAPSSLPDCTRCFQAPLCYLSVLLPLSDQTEFLYFEFCLNPVCFVHLVVVYILLLIIGLKSLVYRLSTSAWFLPHLCSGPENDRLRLFTLLSCYADAFIV